MITVLFYEDKEIPRDKPSIFLAGPVLRGGNYEDDWRKEAVGILTAISDNTGEDFCVYVPESKNGAYEEADIPYEETTKWEWDRLESCDVILFWVPRSKDLPGFTTNVEFGRYTALRPESVVLGYPENAERMQYLEYLYRRLTGNKAHCQLLTTVAMAAAMACCKEKRG